MSYINFIVMVNLEGKGQSIDAVQKQMTEIQPNELFGGEYRVYSESFVSFFSILISVLFRVTAANWIRVKIQSVNVGYSLTL